MKARPQGEGDEGRCRGEALKTVLREATQPLRDSQTAVSSANQLDVKIILASKV